ncbi:u3 small nucleolar ribonucleoprotein MPP10 [Apophysomyces ossiformis]|uniref:U3 small nucleolar ribonucleoprotein protein MPP10 n=1 Tax=Apophysomyces ossiformis TaxID=679940 RepID=A0A8H7ETD8_9FUNG|nr:u3 small nucleolar ribonucleoprotein MPP10 [Apophysomyces ossiformis]
MVAKTSSKRTPTEQFLTNVVDKPHVFFSENPKIASTALEITKYFYDTVKQHEEQTFSPFTELLTEGFDNEQIWEEIATQNEPFLRYAKSTLKEFSRSESKVIDTPEILDDLEEQESSSDHSMDLDEHMNYDDVQLDGKDMSDMEFGDGLDNEFSGEEQEDAEKSHDEEEEEEDEEETSRQDWLETSQFFLIKPTKTSEVDDDFFNLDEFNRWTEKQEELDMMSDRDEDDDEEAIDYDNDLDEEDEDDEDIQDIKYKDFFAPAPKLKKSKKGVTFAADDEQDAQSENDEEEEAFEDMEEDEMEEEEEEKVRNLFDDEEDDQEDDGKTAHEKRLEKIKAQIEQFEEENVNDRHWTMKGETSAKSRPLNSLLEEDLEFDQSVKPVPVITQETTNVLEDMIKKRIADNNFDDVERKREPESRPFLPSKSVEISQDKSKKSLAELYEEDYMKQATGDQTNAKDEALKKEHDEITSMFQTLCTKLDALSNFHFTPKAPQPEITVVSNAAAISMEEIIPVNVADSTLLAPEEVYDKKKTDIKSTTEMDQSERKRARALKKKMKKKEKTMKEREQKVMEKMRPGSVPPKQSKSKAVKELLGQKNVTMIDKDGKKQSTTKAVTSASLF